MLALLNLPKESIYNQFVPKKQFYEHGDLTQREKRLFIDEIERIILYAQLTFENTNIQPYKDNEKTYDEISVFVVELKGQKHVEQIARLIMQAIPYPMIFIAQYEKKYNFYGAHRRDNLQDHTKVILEKIYDTGFIGNDYFITNLCYEKLKKQNIYTLYDNYVQEIIAYNLAKRNVKQTKENEELLQKIESIEEEIKMLRSKMTRESHFNRKTDLNMRIKKLEGKLKQLGV